MELICYTHEGWEPRIRPATPRRDWMDGTPERYAYRCLPLAIANAHGWEILAPCGFSARWTGGGQQEDVEIRVDEGSRPHQYPVSLFGQGTLTFHVEALFRTSPGFNLFVGGPPNGMKDAIAPLGGVIETDWAPYSFTMNWRFTRPGQWIRFEENEPFAFFFPVERGFLSGLAPEIRPLTEQPELLAGFDTWSKSRDDFQKWVKETNPQAPADKWQKLYYRGVCPNGSAGAADHESKLRLAPFRFPDGRALETVDSPPPRPAPPPPPAPPQPPIYGGGAHAIGLPVSDIALNYALRRTGFRASPELPKGGLAAPFAVAMPAAKAESLERRRRDWLLGVMERQRALSPRAGTVPRMRALEADIFLDLFYAPGQPVVIEGSLDDWPALARWTEDDFRGATEALPAMLRGDLGRLDLVTDAPPGLSVAPAGGFEPLSFASGNRLVAQIVGTRRVTLLPASETPRLAPQSGLFSAVVDVDDPARLALFPAAGEAKKFEIELEPGDLLFVPVGWWRQASSESFSAALTWRDFIWPNPGDETYPAEI